jgi:LPXTG-motif cell wall-anchored protein
MAARCNASDECDWRESALVAVAIGGVGLLAGVVVWRRRRRA